MEYILAFGSAHRALKAESILKRGSVAFRLLPAPKALAGHCDLVISVEGDDLSRATGLLTGAGARPRKVFRKVGEAYVEV